MGWELIALWVVSSLLSYALAPKPEEPNPASLGDFQVPTADPNRHIPVVFGTVWINDPNIVWYGDLRTDDIEEDGGWFSDDVTVGYRYYLGVHAALSYPVDSLEEIKFSERTAWVGSVSSGAIYINQPTLFGDSDREGGVAGSVDILMGSSTQAKNAYLVSTIDPIIPAFRGVFSLVFNSFYWGNSKNFPKPIFKVKRTDMQTNFEAQWHPTKANAGVGLNAAHIIRECIVSRAWGLGYTSARVDDANLMAAADTLFDEGFGLCLRWSGAESIEEFVATIGKHVGGVPDVDPDTGLFTFTLIRGGYDVEALLLLDDSNSVLTSFERKGWGETVNEIIVVYHDIETDKDTPTAPVQDIGNIQEQGSVISETVSMPGIPTADLANKVAKSTLRAKAAPLAKIELSDVSRVAFALRRGQVFKYSNPLRGMSEVVFRVADIRRGSLQEGGISITAVEDVFSLEADSYISPQPSGWVSPNTLPVPALYERVVESSYWDVQKVIPQATIATLGADFGYLLTQAVRAASDTYDYQIHSRVLTNPYEFRSKGNFCATAMLVNALSQLGGGLTGDVLDISTGIDLGLVTPGSSAYIGDECVAIQAIDAVAGTVTVDRAVLDSVPTAHAAGSRVWFSEGRQGSDSIEYTAADDVDTKLLPTTSLGTLDIGDATELSFILNNRYQRPYPPGNLTINTVRYPASITGDLVVAWSHRDRTSQLDYLHTQIEGNVGPEVGTTYTLRIYGETDTLIHTASGLTGVSYTYTEAQEITDSGLGRLNTQLRIELESVRASFVSYQIHDVAFARV